jgi:archaemetzincin
MRAVGAISILSLLTVLACSRPGPLPEGAFEPGEPFEPLPAPTAFDWLSMHPEPGQTFEQFVQAKPNRPDRRRNRIYLQPLGELPPDAGLSFKKLQELAEAFFQMEVVVRPPLDLSRESIASRRNPALGHRQLRTGDLIALLKTRLPGDAYALLGLTLEDLYPDENWNFVFGQASTRDRVGVYSLSRYDPRFYGEERTSDWQKMVLRRSCKVLAHETSHMFGIHHCIFYNCLINGGNSLEEMDARPLDLCPIDLRKLHYSVGFDVMERYKQLHDFSEREGFLEEADWFRRRIEHLSR